MNINFNDMIGGYYTNRVTGESYIIGASDRMNEEYNKKRQQNRYELSEVKKHAVPLDPSQFESTLITSENYEEMNKPVAPMPKHCYGIGYGYKLRDLMNETLEDYYVNHKGTKEEIKKLFKDCCKDMRVVLCQERRTTGHDKRDNTQIILDTYEQFRMVNSVMANLGCTKEGEKIAEKNGWQKGDEKDWIYYNADFYYASEELRDIFKEAAEEIASEWGIEEIDVSERDTDHSLSYSSSFHEVWKNGSENGARICTMIDAGKEPPKGFVLFYRECTEGNENIGILKAGIEGQVQKDKKIIFDIYGDGVQQKYSQFYHLYDLLYAGSNTEQAKQFNKYLENFDIYTRYYGTVQMRRH